MYGGIILPHYHFDFYIIKFRSLFPCGGLVAKLSDSFVTSWTVAHQAPLSMGFPKQECWSELPFPSPGDLPHPGTELVSPAGYTDALAGGFFTIYFLGNLHSVITYISMPVYGKYIFCFSLVIAIL